MRQGPLACDTSNSNELQTSFGEKIRYADKQLSAGTSLRNVGLRPVLNKHVKVSKSAPPEIPHTPPHTKIQDHLRGQVQHKHTPVTTSRLLRNVSPQATLKPELLLENEEKPPPKTKTRSKFEKLRENLKTKVSNE